MYKLTFEKLKTVLLIKISAPKLLVILIVSVVLVDWWSCFSELFSRTDQCTIAWAKERRYRESFFARVDNCTMPNALVSSITQGLANVQEYNSCHMCIYNAVTSINGHEIYEIWLLLNLFTIQSCKFCFKIV
jgi:hypothetical protein